MNRFEEIAKKNDLANSEVYFFIKKLVLDEIISRSKSCTNPQILQGMLQVFDFIDGWKTDFLKEKEKLNK